jgi:hypothetical protein
MTIEQINRLFKELDLAEPLVEYNDSKSEFYLDSLARMYADEGFRKFLINNYNNAVKSASLRSVNEVDIAFSKARALTIKEILIRAKDAFEKADKIRKLKINAEKQSKK